MGYFTDKDLRKIAGNTYNNYHGENYEFIAHKIHSNKEKEFKAINKKADKIGYVTPELNEKRYSLYQQLMEEIKEKSPEEYEKVYSRL